MKTYPKHYWASDNEWVPHKAMMKWECCDCGLVHNVEFKLEILKVRMVRNQVDTKKARKRKGIKLA